VETAIWVPKLIRRDYQMALSQVGNGVDDPDQNYPENYVCGSRTYMDYCNKEVDALIARGLPADAGSRQVTLPCCYDDPEFAPDLTEVAERTKKTPEQVIAAHLASPFKVYVLGFMPGLAYVAGLDQALFLPRRSQPRVRVPRSSVAIAMDMTTIYPFESPGGWHLIGRTPLWMFDKRREQPVFLSPGDSLSFERIDRRSFDRIAGEVEAGTFDWSSLVKIK
jgi:KipI family sensor histidine kinase inhibitor